MMRSIIALFAASLFLCSASSDARTIPPQTGTIASQSMARVNLDLPVNAFSLISVAGSGGDLDCYLYTAATPGKLLGIFVTRDDSSMDGCVIGITPQPGNEKYMLLVQNASNHDESYTVTVQ
jgi:hypothetical protein